MRRAACLLLALAATAPPAAAQVSLGEAVTPPAAVPTGIVILDQDRLYRDSRFGQRMLAAIDAQLKTLQTENRSLEADLEAEEKSLTARRPTLPAEEFQALAKAFDIKVKGIRTARDAKSRDLAAQRDTAQKTFLKTAVPVLARILTEQNAAAIVDRSAVILSFDRIDITDLAIARIDAQLLDATPAPQPAPPAPAPRRRPDLPGRGQVARQAPRRPRHVRSASIRYAP